MKKGTPKDKVFRNTSKVKYLKVILGRLETEYIPILQLVIDYNNKNDRSIGFWSLIRIIFPVVETVASITGKQKEDFLEEELKVPFGHLVWELYRNALMHTDELRYAVYKGRNFGWGAHLRMDGKGHFVANHTNTHPTTVHIDISQLYYSLRDFLKREIDKNKDIQIQIQVGVHFPEHENKLIKELEELYKKF